MIFRQVSELLQNILTITFKNVYRLPYETLSSALKLIVIQCMYITAVCVRSLIKLRWLNYEFIRYCYCFFCFVNISLFLKKKKKEISPSPA